MSRSLLQPDGEKECYFTGVQTGLDLHHVYAGSNRSNSEKWGCWVWIKHEIHMDLHDRDKRIDKRLKEDCQRAFETEYAEKAPEQYGMNSHDLFRSIFGKSYL